jgi:hypothetical protein
VLRGSFRNTGPAQRPLVRQRYEHDDQPDQKGNSQEGWQSQSHDRQPRLQDGTRAHGDHESTDRKDNRRAEEATPDHGERS